MLPTFFKDLQISKSIEEILEREDVSQEEKNEALKKLVEAEMNSREFAGNIVKFTRFLGLSIDTIDNEIKALKEKKERMEALKEKIENDIKNYMLLKNIDDIQCGAYRLKLRKSDICIIYDEDKIPSEFKTIEVVTKINKNDIKKAIKEGKQVEGAGIEETYHLNIK